MVCGLSYGLWGCELCGKVNVVWTYVMYVCGM